jgi:Rv0078B-related antitoxin
MARRYEVPLNFEVVDDEMTALWRQKSGTERLRIAGQMFDAARRMLVCYLRQNHTDWSEDQIQAEASRRIAHGYR